MLKIDLHSHTLMSGHAFNTLLEMVHQASLNKMEAIAITDHGPSMSKALDYKYFGMGSRIPKEIEGVKVIFGCEANVVDLEGTIDISEKNQGRLELVMVGLHEMTPFPEDGSIDENTRALVKAVEKNDIHVISHPYRDRMKVHTEEIAKAAAKYNVALEINLSLLKISKKEDHQKVFFDIIDLAEKYDLKVTVSTDAHSIGELGDDSILKELGYTIPQNLILGSQGGYDEIMEFLQKK